MHPRGNEWNKRRAETPPKAPATHSCLDVKAKLGTHVHPWLSHVNVWQKPLQYGKVISLQLKLINELFFKKQCCLQIKQTSGYLVGRDWDFPSEPVVAMTLGFHCRGHGFGPWLGN